MTYSLDGLFWFAIGLWISDDTIVSEDFSVFLFLVQSVVLGCCFPQVVFRSGDIAGQVIASTFGTVVSSVSISTLSTVVVIDEVENPTLGFEHLLSTDGTYIVVVFSFH